MFHKFLYTVGLHRICLRAEVCNLVFIICSLVVGIGCVTDTWKVEWKLHFLEWKTPSLVLSLVCSTLKIAFEGVDDTVSYSIQTCQVLQFLMKPMLPLENLNLGGGVLKKSFQFILKSQGKNFQPWKKHLSSPTLLGLFQTTCKLLLRLDGDIGWLPMHCFTAKPQTIINGS